MMKKGLISVIGVGMAWLVFSSPCTGADFKSAELQRKVAEIASLRIKLAEKIERAEDMRGQLAALKDGYAAEIRHEKNRWQVASYRNAIGNPRIGYDLRLLQQLDGEVLDHYFRQINDDLMMIRTLDDFTVDRLISKINDALDEYVPATIKKTILVNQLPLKDLEILWQEVVLLSEN
jgi:hypothetical protein